MPLNITITDAGRAAIVNADNSGTAPVTVTQIGISETAHVPAPANVALPGELKRIAAVSGLVVSDDTIHLSISDASVDNYSLRSFALYLADGTLFAIYGQADPILVKVTASIAALSVDVTFVDIDAADITFGDASFVNPPASETVAGVARIATQARVDAAADGADDAQTIVTPKTLRARLAAFIAGVNTTIANFTASVNAQIAALTARTITGGGLVTGGGSLAANRTLTVTAASGAELQAATTNGRAVTPASFGALPRSTGAVGYEVSPRGTLVQRGLKRVTTSDSQQSATITFPIAFADTNYDLQLTTVIPSIGDFDNFAQEVNGTRTTTGVTIFLQDASGGGSSVLAGFNWRAEGLA